MMTPGQIKTTLTGVMGATAILLMQLEGTHYKVYIDIAGIPTVCEGITGPDVIMGKTYTRYECDKLLEKHINVAKREVDRDIKVKVPDTFRASMYSFTFNAGTGAYRYSRMLTLTNQGHLYEACEQLHRWIYYTNPKTGKKEVANGLKNRRATEFKTCIKDL